MPNLLTTRVTLNTGPLFFGTLFKHYFARVVSDGSKIGVPLRREELLYDEAFNIAKVLLAAYFVNPIECYHSSKGFMNVATRYIPISLALVSKCSVSGS